jgi:glyceraldehyde 3-phosphate dehydrogenase
VAAITFVAHTTSQDALVIEDGSARHSALVSALSVQLAAVESTVTRPNPMTKPRDVVLYGFGRIGRILARMMIAKTGAGLKMLLRAIVVRKKSADELIKRAYLLAQDSVHGRFPGTVTVDEANNAIIANGNIIHLIHASSPEEVDYTAYGIHDAIIVDNTGVWRDAAGLGKHLKSKGASKVVLTAPAKGSDVPTVVVGVNDDRVLDAHSMYSAASCTTNAIVPSLKVLNEVFGIVSGHVETVHSYTNDQNLIDNFHSKARRGRAAALNLVLTETGAAEAVAKSIPELAGKLTGNAIRVPTPNVSMAILILQTKKEVSVESVNKVLFEESTWGPLHLQIGYSHDKDAVSSDFVGEGHTGVVDGPATIAANKRVNLYIWYDNEWGYSAQVIRLVQKIAGVEFPNFPVRVAVSAAAEAAGAAESV